MRLCAGIFVALLTGLPGRVTAQNHAPAQGSVYEQARRLAASGRLKQAIELLDRSAAAGLRTPELYNLRAQLRTAVGDLDGAERDYKSAAQLDPCDVVSRLSLGRLYQSRALWPEAIYCYREILLMAPRNTDAVLGLADAYEKLGRRVAAQNLLGAASATLSDRRVHKRWVRTAIAAGKTEEAEAALQRLAASVEGTDKRDALVELAKLRLSAGRLEAALEAARQALAIEQPSGALDQTTYDVVALATDSEVRQVGDSLRVTLSELDRRALPREEAFATLEALGARLAQAERSISDLSAPESRRSDHARRLYAYALAREAALNALTFVDVALQGQREAFARRLEQVDSEIDRLLHKRP